MPLFFYKAVDIQGKNLSGSLQAESFETAKELLKKERLYVTHIKINGDKEKKWRVSAAMRLSFTRDMAQLLKAGLPVYESLLTIQEKQGDSSPLFLGLIEQVRTGKGLSTAVASYPETFDPIYIAMLQSAEQSGSLSKTFEELYQLLTRQSKLKRQLIGALTYPALLATFCFIVIGVLFIFVIPSMKELFEGRELHPITSLVLFISDLLKSYGHILILALTFFVGGAFLICRSHRGKSVIYELLHKIPLLKKILLISAVVRFSRTLSLLLSSGVSVIDSLQLVEKVTRHPLLENVLAKASKKVLEGEKLSAQFEKTEFPSLVPRLLAIAEETGKMSPMLYSLAEIYEEELDRSLSQITSLLQPLLLLLLGVIIGVVVLSILLPLTDVSSFT